MSTEIKRTQSINSWILGIVIKVPISEIVDGSYTATVEGCPKCDRYLKTYCRHYSDGKLVPRDKFCKYCGSENELTQKEMPEDIPYPDIRDYLEQNKLNYASFSEDIEEKEWVVIAKPIETIGTRNFYCHGAVADIKSSYEKELKEVKEKHKAFIKKYKAKVTISIVSEFFDW